MCHVEEMCGEDWNLSRVAIFLAAGDAENVLRNSFSGGQQVSSGLTCYSVIPLGQQRLIPETFAGLTTTLLYH